jgi:SAM-dependent methyltransferase
MSDVEYSEAALVERDKYMQMWADHPVYRAVAEGSNALDAALAIAKPPPGASFIDFGTGTGRAAAKLQDCGYTVQAVDFVPHCMDEGIDVPFIEANLWELPEMSADFGYCTDVMEHIPEEHVDAVLEGIKRCVPKAVFTIHTGPDNCGSAIDEILHVTQRSLMWWGQRLTEHFEVVEPHTNAFQMFYVER